jgi:hypothetical protein
MFCEWVEVAFSWGYVATGAGRKFLRNVVKITSQLCALWYKTVMMCTYNAVMSVVLRVLTVNIFVFWDTTPCSFIRH